MNNNLYHWHDEQVVRHEMQEVDRAVEQERLLREAGLSYRDLLARAAHSIRSLLKTRRARGQEKSSVQQKSCLSMKEHS